MNNKTKLKRFAQLTMMFTGIYIVLFLLFSAISVASYYGGGDGFFSFFASIFGNLANPSLRFLAIVVTLVMSVCIYHEKCQTKAVIITDAVLACICLVMILCEGVSNFFLSFISAFDWTKFIFGLIYVLLSSLYIYACFKSGLMDSFVGSDEDQLSLPEANDDQQDTEDKK